MTPDLASTGLAIAGVGQTAYRRSHRGSTPELVHAAVRAALDHAGLTHRDIDIVVGGFAPDALAGIASGVNNAVARAAQLLAVAALLLLSGAIISVLGIWFAVRAIVGVVYLARDEAYPRPKSYLV